MNSLCTAAALTVRAGKARLASNLAEFKFLLTLPYNADTQAAMAAVCRSNTRILAEIQEAERLLPAGSDGACMEAGA